MPESNRSSPPSSPTPCEPPPPPPLPPPPPSRTLPAKIGVTTHTVGATAEPEPFKPVYYFFYGTLMKPDILKAVLGLDTEPVLRTAKVYGFELTNWGQYRALIDGTPGAVVSGCAYMVRSTEEAYKLAYYETDSYALTPCKIYFTDENNEKENEAVHGKTFKYAGDGQALREGRFDRTLWEIRMGQRLPGRWHGEERQTGQYGPGASR
ncbi:hypothetical protein C8A03DRAFT_11953 [Achaetomium macrosporum]|uniref:Putative gamma-glutamylcyclotransferase n=1 Tax=Achaetomium macrosporum TaxID=79813 RepID=A0AAN7HG43_9PEZI|nr:hypothetical protein C8A03DRAFT_11953 [Achaetomium macrosporum]